MSFSAFYAVRFSPAPELGEWLNVAVVGEGITEHKAGIIVTDSMERIEAAFGADAVERVAAICKDLAHLVAAMSSAYDRGEKTQPIPTAMKDQALSLSFSEQIIVFEGSFEEALRSIANKYLSSADAQEELAQHIEAHTSIRKTKEEDSETDLGRIASSIQNRLAKFSREVMPATLAKSLEQGQKAIETIVRGPEISTVLVIGGAGHLGSALLPRLLDEGKWVRLIDPSGSGSTVVELFNPKATRGSTLSDVAKRAKVSLESVVQVLNGSPEQQPVSQKTADKIRDVASKLGYQVSASGFSNLRTDDIASSMDGVDVVIYVPDSASGQSAADRLATGGAYAKTAKSHGVKRFVIASSGLLREKSNAELEKALGGLSDDRFTVSILRLGELFGLSSTAQWFGDLHDADGNLTSYPSVNALTARAVLDGTVAIVNSEPRPFLHVEDAVDSILSVIEAPAERVNAQVYTVATENQILTVGEVARLIQRQVPRADFVISTGEVAASIPPEELTKIYDDLGFAPKRSLELGIAQLIIALQDGSVTRYMAVGSVDPEVLATAAPASEINWDNLTYASVEVETGESVSDQSIQKH